MAKNLRDKKYAGLFSSVAIVNVYASMESLENYTSQVKQMQSFELMGSADSIIGLLTAGLAGITGALALHYATRRQEKE